MVCNGNLYDYNKKEGLFVDYTGGHVFSQYIGNIDIRSSFIKDIGLTNETMKDIYNKYNCDTTKICHDIFIKIVHHKINELKEMQISILPKHIFEWTEYMISELMLRIEKIDKLLAIYNPIML